MKTDKYILKNMRLNLIVFKKKAYKEQQQQKQMTFSKKSKKKPKGLKFLMRARTFK